MTGGELQIGELQEGVFDDAYGYAGDPHLAHPSPCFGEDRVLRYWSNQSRLAQRFGRRAELKNQFALVAENRLG